MSVVNSRALKVSANHALGQLKRLFLVADELLQRDVGNVESTEGIKLCREYLGELESLGNKICVVVKQLEGVNERWLQLLGTLDSDVAESETEYYEKTVADENSFVNQIQKACECICNVQQKIRSTDTNLSQVYSQQQTMLQDSLSSQSNVRLPTLKIKEFDGNIFEWLAFWANFSNSVDSQPIPDIQKLSYLLGLLKGKAQNVIRGYEVTDANYKIIVDLLKQKFGNNDVVTRLLHEELKSLPSASNNKAWHPLLKVPKEYSGNWSLEA